MYKYRKKGEEHRKNNLECQDVVDGREEKGILVLAAADGAGETDWASVGAGLVVKTMIEILLYYFEELYTMKKEDIRYKIMEKIRDKLYETCDQHNILIEELKSTLMAVAYEKETRRLIKLHLGDGYIVAKEGGEYRIISHPRNRGNRYRTYLTSTIPTTDKLEVYCGVSEDLQELCLMTDGWLELVPTKNDIPGLIPKILEGKEWKTEDDLGFIFEKLS